MTDEQRKRIHAIEYSCDSRAELAERIVKLEELAQGLWFAAQYLVMSPDGATGSGFARQMRELRIEVDDG